MPHTRRENSKWATAKEEQVIRQEKNLDAKTKEAEATEGERDKARGGGSKVRPRKTA